MNGDLFVQIIIGIIMIISALVSAYVVPFVKAKINYIEMEQLYAFTKKCVMWANQTIPPELTEKKKNQVMDSVQVFIKNNLHIELTKSQIDTIIEAFVIECKKGI